MPVKAAPAPAPVVAPVNWTGFYIGGHVGGAWLNNDWNVPSDPLNIAGGCAGCPRPAGSHTDSSWAAGIQGGFNYQINNWLIGVEADVSWTDLNGSSTSLFIPPSTINSKTDDFGTITGRLGMTWDRALLYVKGGGAWSHDKYFTTLIGNPTVPAQEADDTRWGWTIGGGLEYMFWKNWTAKVEYDYLDFGTTRETVRPLPACAGCAAFDYDVRQRISVVKVGINYLFNGATFGR